MLYTQFVLLYILASLSFHLCVSYIFACRPRFACKLRFVEVCLHISWRKAEGRLLIANMPLSHFKPLIIVSHMASKAATFIRTILNALPGALSNVTHEGMLLEMQWRMNHEERANGENRNWKK